MGAVRTAVRTHAAPVDITSRYLSEIGEHSLLSASEEIELATRIRSGCQISRETMISANLRLVVHIARNYINQGLPLLDLVEEGNLGLIHAVDKFDPERGCRFSTYAGYWIRQAMERGLINQAPTVRLPVHVVRKVRKCSRKAAELSQTLDAAPTSGQLASAMGETTESVDALLGFKNLKPAIGRKSGSGRFDVLESVADQDCDHPDYRCASEAAQVQLQHWLEQLEPLQLQVVQLRYGLDGSGKTTLREVAELLGLSSERVRQIQLAAIAELKKISEAQGCEGLPFLD